MFLGLPRTPRSTGVLGREPLAFTGGKRAGFLQKHPAPAVLCPELASLPPQPWKRGHMTKGPCCTAPWDSVSPKVAMSRNSWVQVMVEEHAQVAPVGEKLCSTGVQTRGCSQGKGSRERGWGTEPITPTLWLSEP